jgi:hypothetical protein
MAALADVMSCSRGLLFDFDGPICGIFGGLSAPLIAADLRERVAGRGVGVPREVATSAIRSMSCATQRPSAQTRPKPSPTSYERWSYALSR